MSKSTSRFEKKFLDIIAEDLTVGDVVGGSEGGFDPNSNITSTDFYAPGDARKPTSLFGGVLKRTGLSKKNKRRKRKKRRVKRKTKN